MLALALLLAVASCGPHREQQVQFGNGDVTLAGSLFMPSGNGPHPAIVFVHGDGPDTRDGYEFLADLFARRGLAALIYDKRGTGRSTGDWRTARFSDLAGDATAAVALLRSRSDVDHSRIGVWGGSQGAWIALLAAVRSAPTAFVIVKSGAATSPARLAAAKSIGRVKEAGFSEDVVARVERLMALQFQILRTGAGWEALEAEVNQVRAEPWYPQVAVMRHSTWRSSWMEYGRDIDFDPGPLLGSLDAPMLWLFGERDPEVPVAETVAVLDGLRQRKDITVKVFPGADHQIELPRLDPQRPNYAPGYPDSMIDWAVARVAAPASSR